MSRLLDIIAGGGVVVLYGPPANLQPLIADEIALRAARSGCHVVVLVEGEGAKGQLLDRIIAWRARKGVAAGERMRVEVLDERDLTKAPDFGTALLQKLHDIGFKPHLIVSSAPAYDAQGLAGPAATRLLDAARMLNAAPGITFVIAGHVGPQPGAKPEIAGAALWSCVAGRNLTVTLTGPGGTMTLAGREIGRNALAFDEEPETERVS